MSDLRTLIEKTRNELNQLILSEDFEVYYEKSVELDKLIEKYLEAEEQYA